MKLKRFNQLNEEAFDASSVADDRPYYGELLEELRNVTGRYASHLDPEEINDALNTIADEYKEKY